MRRYTTAPILSGGTFYGTFVPGKILREAALAGAINVRQDFLREGERLDTVAGAMYGDSRLWWIIAGCSGIGWSLQVPAGTSLLIPTNLSEVATLV